MIGILRVRDGVLDYGSDARIQYPLRVLALSNFQRLLWISSAQAPSHLTPIRCCQFTIRLSSAQSAGVCSC